MIKQLLNGLISQTTQRLYHSLSVKKSWMKGGLEGWLTVVVSGMDSGYVRYSWTIIPPTSPLPILLKIFNLIRRWWGWWIVRISGWKSLKSLEISSKNVMYIHLNKTQKSFSRTKNVYNGLFKKKSVPRPSPCWGERNSRGVYPQQGGGYVLLLKKPNFKSGLIILNMFFIYISGVFSVDYFDVPIWIFQRFREI